MEFHIKIIGWLLIILATVHIIFPSYFKWKEDLSSLSLINRQVMKVHTFFIALTVMMMGILCLVSTDDLMHTHLGKTISLGFAIFWSCRLLIQLFGYSYRLWYGKIFETIVHIVFTALWSYLSIIFWMNTLLWID